MNKGIILRLCLGLLSCGLTGGLSATTYYLLEEIRVPAGLLQMKDLLIPAAGDKSALIPATPLKITIQPNQLTILPASLISSHLNQSRIGTVILIGSQALVVPEELAGTSCPQFYFSLGRFFLDYYAGPGFRMDLSLASPPPPAAACPPRGFHFTLLEHSRIEGHLNGETRVYYDPGLGSGGILTLQIAQTRTPGKATTPEAGSPHPFSTVPGLPGYTSAAEALPKIVKGGELITIRFIKKGIQLKMKGRAFSSGALGARVTVKPSTTDKRFEGVVTGTKEVLVEMD